MTMPTPVVYLYCYHQGSPEINLRYIILFCRLYQGVVNPLTSSLITSLNVTNISPKLIAMCEPIGILPSLRYNHTDYTVGFIWL